MFQRVSEALQGVRKFSEVNQRVFRRIFIEFLNGVFERLLEFPDRYRRLRQL